MLLTALLSVTFVSQVTALCSRTFLKNATQTYLAAQEGGKGVPGLFKLAANHTYLENDKPADLDKGILSKALKIDHSITTHDAVQCGAFVEIIAADPAAPHVIGTRMLFDRNSTLLTRMESIVTTTGDWAFNATGYLYWASRENWDPIPADKQDTRAVIQAAGDAYFDRFANASVVVPWGTPCARLEGGAYTGQRDNGTGSTCDLGLPSTIHVTDRRYIVDEEMGTVDIFLGFPELDRTQGETPMPDSHVFRVEGGKIRAIHTVSTCVTPGCGVDFGALSGN